MSIFIVKYYLYIRYYGCYHWEYLFYYSLTRSFPSIEILRLIIIVITIDLRYGRAKESSRTFILLKYIPA